MLIAFSASAMLHGLLLVVAASGHAGESRRTREVATDPVVVSLREHEPPRELGTQMAGAGGGAQNEGQPARSRHSRERQLEHRPAPTTVSMPRRVAPEVDQHDDEPALVASSAVEGEDVGDTAVPSSGGPGAVQRPADGTGSGCCASGDQKPTAGARTPPREPARPLVSPHPIYPRQARLMGWEGTVVLQLLVDTQGNLAKVTLVTGSGFALLDESAVDAARRWRFEPAREGGRPTAMVHEVRFRFRLDNAMG